MRPNKPYVYILGDFMDQLSKLSSTELNDFLAKTEAEIKRRSKIEKATVEVNKILTKYQISFNELYSGLSGNGNTSKLKTKKNSKVKKRKETDRRSTVIPKYKDPKSENKWTGRGRTPSWVLELCEQENIQLVDFKNDPRFKL